MYFIIVRFAKKVYLRKGGSYLKGAIFDVDGTILDSMGIWCNITNKFFERHGIVISTEKMLSYQSMSLEESIPLIRLEYLPDISHEDMFDELCRMAADAYRNEIPAKKGVCEYIRRLHDDGVKTAVATSGFPELCTAALSRIGIIDCIDAFAYSSEVGCSKSQPDIYLLAAGRIGLLPEECTVFEDIVAGIDSAGKAGFKTVAVEDIANSHDKDVLIQHSDRYITGWSEMLSNI